MAPDHGETVARILNACWWVRHYRRRSRITTASRQQAILALGLILRDAFTRTDDFEPLLAALLDGLRPQEEDPPF